MNKCFKKVRRKDYAESCTRKRRPNASRAVPEKNETEGISTVRLIKFWKDQEQSSELIREGNSVYWNGVSPLSMPMSFAEKVMKAEK